MEEISNVYTYRRFLKRYYYEIREEGLYLKSRRSSTKQEFTFSFDVIPCEPTYYTHRSKVAFWFMVVFVFFFLFGFVLLFTEEDVDIRNFFIWDPGAVITAGWYFLSRKNYFIFQGPDGSRFSICFPARHLQKVNDFIAQIEKAKLIYLENKIKQYLPILGRDRINTRIIELRENLVINNSGYELLMEKVNKLDSPDIMGFRKNQNEEADKRQN